MINASNVEIQNFSSSCAEGKGRARTEFQDLFGWIIDNYPMRTFHFPGDRAAESYMYVFEEDRVFRRVRGFARNEAESGTYRNVSVLLKFTWT